MRRRSSNLVMFTYRRVNAKSGSSQASRRDNCSYYMIFDENGRRVDSFLSPTNARKQYSPLLKQSSQGVLRGQRRLV